MACTVASSSTTAAAAGAGYHNRLLSGRAQLPPVSEMQAHRAAHYAQMQAEGVPLRHCHMMGEQQWAYNDWLAEAAGADVAKVGPRVDTGNLPHNGCYDGAAT